MREIPWKGVFVVLIIAGLVPWVIWWPYGRWGIEILIPIAVGLFALLFLLTFALAAKFGKTFKKAKA